VCERERRKRERERERERVCERERYRSTLLLDAEDLVVLEVAPRHLLLHPRDYLRKAKCK
jgi:hypothetical protein